MSAIEKAESRLFALGAKLASLECKAVKRLHRATDAPKQYRLSQVRHLRSELTGYRSCLVDKKDDSDDELLAAVDAAIKAVDEIRVELGGR